MAEMVLKFLDGTMKPLCLFDSTIVDPLGVVLDDDVVVPAKHKVFKTARVRNPTANENILELSMNLSGKGVLRQESWYSKKSREYPFRL